MMRMLVLVALGPLLAATPVMVTPVSAQEACATWTAEMVEDEGGSVLAAFACATEQPEAYTFLYCFDGSFFLSTDLAYETDVLPDLGEITDVRFAVGDKGEMLSMTYQEMDGRHAADLAADAPLVQLLRSNGTLVIGDVAGKYPARSYSLEGAPAALDKLLADCR